jgi:hypothetical protein
MDNVELSMSGVDNIPGCCFVREPNRWKRILNAQYTQIFLECTQAMYAMPGVTPVQELVESNQPDNQPQGFGRAWG